MNAGNSSGPHLRFTPGPVLAGAVRGAVWVGGGTGRWWADVYYSTNRAPAGRVFERAEVDAYPDAGAISASFDTRAEAIAFARATVASLRARLDATRLRDSADRLAAVVNAGTITPGEASAAVGVAPGNPDPTEAP